MLSYVPTFFMFGLFSEPEKFDPRVRFNVGQGMIYSIASGARIVIVAILSALMEALMKTEVKTEQQLWGFGTAIYSASEAVNPAADVISTILWMLC